MASTSFTREAELHWIALRLVPGLGARKAVQLLERLGSPQRIFAASRSELEAAGVTGGVAQSIASGCAFEDAAAQQDLMQECGAELISFQDQRFPAALREIYDPPVVLFARGRIEILDTAILGVVGTRRPTPYGMAAAERLSSDLALAGFTIISGMARGIDTAAHRAALDAGGNTIAVFGNGVDQVYPAENRRLAAEIAGKGLVISEFPMGTPSYPQNFPVRNRIIAGASLGVLVVEGAQYSGSAITAKLAMDAGRGVFAVPGNITSKMSWGPNLLIKQGAKLVQEWSDIANELSPEDRRRAASQTRTAQQSLALDEGETMPSQAEKLPDLASRVLAMLKVDATVHIDVLVESLGTSSAAELIAALFDLEMRGLVRQMPGRNFVRVW